MAAKQRAAHIARKAIATFKKVDAGTEAEIDLLLFCAEMGVACAQQYPDIGSSLYNSIHDAYLDAARALQTLDDPSVTVALRPRFAKIREDIGDAGYGLHENLMDIFLNYVQIDEEDETWGSRPAKPRRLSVCHLDPEIPNHRDGLGFYLVVVATRLVHLHNERA